MLPPHPPPALFQPSVTFRDAAHAAGVSTKTLRNWLDRGQITLQKDEERPEGGWRRFTPFDVARVAIMGRIVDYGFSVSAADALMAKYFDCSAPGLHATQQMIPDIASGSALSMVFGAKVLILCRDGRSALLQGLPGDTVSMVSSKGVIGEFAGGEPYIGSEWFAAEASSLQDFTVIRIGAIAKEACARTTAAWGEVE